MTPTKKLEATKPEVKTTSQQASAAQPQPSKQQQTLDALKLKWQERKVDLGKLEVKQDGKFMVVVVGPNWPTIKIGPSGGGDIAELKSFTKFFDAAVVADELFAKQNARQQKKASASVPAPVAEAKKPELKAETPAARKQKQHGQIEQRMQA